MRCDTQGKKINELNGKIYKWWAREDSNLQPSGYERPTLSGKFSKNRHFCRRSCAFVHVWLRRFIGYLLVGCGLASLRPPIAASVRSSKRFTGLNMLQRPPTFSAAGLLTGVLGCRKRAIDRTSPPCDINGARQIGCSESFRCGDRVVQTRAAVGGSWPPSRKWFGPNCQKTSLASEWCKAASVSRWTLKISGPAYDKSRARKMHRHVSDERVVSADRDFIDR